MNLDVLLLLTYIFVHALIEYANIIWGPFYTLDQQKFAVRPYDQLAADKAPRVWLWRMFDQPKVTIIGQVYRWFCGDIIEVYNIHNQS